MEQIAQKSNISKPSRVAYAKRFFSSLSYFKINEIGDWHRLLAALSQMQLAKHDGLPMISLVNCIYTQLQKKPISHFLGHLW